MDLLNVLLPYWNLRISSWLTALTGILILCLLIGKKGGRLHIGLWASILLISVFVVYMNTEKALSAPPSPALAANALRDALFWWHQEIGLIYFALLFVIPFFGVPVKLALRFKWRKPAVILRRIHGLAGYAIALTWVISNAASEIARRLPMS